MDIKNIKIKFGFIIHIFLFCLISLLFFINLNLNITPNMVNIANMTQDLLQGDVFLKTWDLSYCSNLFTQIFYYLIPVKLFGNSSLAILSAVFLVFITTIYSGIILIKDNYQEIQFIDILLFICFCGMGSSFLNFIAINASYIPFIFLILFFTNKYLNTDNEKNLIFVSIISIFLAFGDIFSVVLCFIPIISYCLIKIFHALSNPENNPKKYYKLISIIILSAGLGFSLYLQYISFNGSPQIYGWLHSKYFIDIYSNEGTISYLPIITQYFLNIQNVNFSGNNIFSLNTVLYFCRIIITLSGLVFVIKNICNTASNKNEHNNFISFTLSLGLIFLFIFIFLIDSKPNEYIEQILSVIPFSIALILLRYSNCFKELSQLQKNILLWILIIVVLLIPINSTIGNLQNNYKKISLEKLFPITENSIYYCNYIKRIQTGQNE